MELDRQSIEKRDFPIGRRGYDPAAVDAHLRSIASDVEALRYALESRAGETLGSSAGTQVQGILEAAEATAADIQQRAADDAHQTRAQAATDAERTRADAIARAQAHVAAVARATAVLSERVEAMDGQSAALVAALRDGAGRLATDLSAVETNMAELYDAASGRAGGASEVEFEQEDALAAPTPMWDPSVSQVPADPGVEVPVMPGHSEFVPAAPSPSEPPLPEPPPAAPMPLQQTIPTPTQQTAPAPTPSSPMPSHTPEPAGSSGEDLDGARLIALNMALNGESRVATDRYLAENYQLPDRHKLLDEVFAAVEG